MESEKKQLGRFLSLVLRHRPERIGIQLDEGGWVEVEKLLIALRQHGMAVERSTLDDVVKTNDKQRFSYNRDGSKIRANQGHSVPVNLGLEPVQPPRWLYHGTGKKYVSSIQREGLRRRTRHHVHLSIDPETARRVGQRHGKPVIFKVWAETMNEDGHVFYRSANGVWLTESVPVRYLEPMEEDSF
jgi:putative RNA 2'-phosphotransferase